LRSGVCTVGMPRNVSGEFDQVGRSEHISVSMIFM
jgi:hypothetical protein